MIAEVFDRIYRANAWNGVESRSGPGSGSAATTKVADAIVRLVEELAIKTVLNIGCGDDYWMPDLPVWYAGVDVSEEAIARARANHPDRRYEVWDAIGLGAWSNRADLVILRDVLQHLPLGLCQDIVDGPSDNGSRYLLASTFRGGQNVDIAPGESYSPDLEQEPFTLGSPERLIVDGYPYDGGPGLRDPRKFLGLWRLT